MSKVPGMLTLRGDGLPTDPRETTAQAMVNPEIQALFELALEAKLPRNRELRSWEPQRLNERHLTMVMMRASGLKQRQIAEIVGCTDSNASIVLNHPDAEYLLSRLQAARFSIPHKYEERLQALNDAAVDAIEELLTDVEIPAARRAPAAFKLLGMNGYGREKPAETNVNIHLDATSAEMGLLARALRESRQIQEAEVVDSFPGPGGELAVSPPSQLPSGTGAPSVGGSQVQETLSTENNA